MIERIVHSKQFNIATTIAIVICSIVLGVETYYPSNERLPLLFYVLDWVFAVYFLIEIVLRMIASKSIIAFFKFYQWKEVKINDKTEKKFNFVEDGVWNCFDTVIVVVTTVSLFAHFFDHPELLAVMRLFRVFRILRLLEISKEMKQVQSKIISIIPTVFSFASLLLALIYIYAIVGVFLFQQHSYENADFSNLQNAALTLFQCITLEGWSDIMYQSLQKPHHYGNWFIRGYFISFIILTVIVSFNVFVAVLTSQVQEKISEETQKEEVKLGEHIDNARQTLEKELQELKTTIEKLHDEIKNLKK